MADQGNKKTNDQAATANDARQGDERRGSERRRAQDRRQKDVAGVPERRRSADRRTKGPEAERRKVERRINEYRLKPEVLEFINAVNEFKSVNQKPFPTWTEIFEIFTNLGYRKVQE